MTPAPKGLDEKREEFRETAAAAFGKCWPAAILSRAGGTPPEGAETTWGLERP